MYKHVCMLICVLLCMHDILCRYVLYIVDIREELKAHYCINMVNFRLVKLHHKDKQCDNSVA